MAAADDAEPESTAPSGPTLDQLSSRELEILTMLGEGRSNRDIARRLKITERTVKAHITNVLGKLGLESRLQAGLLALAVGLAHFENSAAGAQRSN